MKKVGVTLDEEVKPRNLSQPAWVVGLMPTAPTEAENDTVVEALGDTLVEAMKPRPWADQLALPEMMTVLSELLSWLGSCGPVKVLI